VSPATAELRPFPIVDVELDRARLELYDRLLHGDLPRASVAASNVVRLALELRVILAAMRRAEPIPLA
jgi:hypothetical protein